MKVRSWFLALLVALPIVGIGSAATLILPPIEEQLVEGHTVFTVVQTLPEDNSTRTEFAAAVAVLVREVQVTVSASRFPGVLWFNDQYLTNQYQNVNVNTQFRYPCGAVLAVPAGDPDPRPLFNATINPTPPTYVESYHIVDPNDKQWDVDKWQDADGRFIWTVALMNNQARYSDEDDGTSQCGSAVDGLCASGFYLPTGQCIVYAAAIPNGPRYARNPGDHGRGYPCGGAGDPPCNQVLHYNAVLFFYLDDLPADGTKDHTEGSTDYNADVAACHSPSYKYSADTFVWPCPEGDDDREGNSHPYNPERPWPYHRGVGRDNHGGSADCDGDALADQNCHATARVDIYYGAAMQPILREYRLIEMQGHDAPYHCHDGNVCSPQDAMP